MQRDIALLLHMLEWRSASHSHEIAPGLSLYPMAGSTIEASYHRLCTEAGVDGGEPFEYRSYALFRPSDAYPRGVDFDDPYSVVDRFLTVLVVEYAQPFVVARVMLPHESLIRSPKSRRVYLPYGHNEFLLKKQRSAITPETAAAISAMWQNAEKLWQRQGSRSRLINALTYFGYAWRSQYIDQICINLAIALEALFAPHTHGETTHQISFNVARFAARRDSEAQQTIYDDVRAFYGLRSAVVHGGSANEDDLITQLPPIFRLTAQVIRTILLSAESVDHFEAERLRRKLLRDLMFGSQ